MQLLSEALTRLAIVTFLSETAAAARLAPNQWHEAACGWLAILTGRQTLPVVATRDSHAAQELFHSGYFDWNQQSQLALLSEPGHPPAIDYDLVKQCLDRSSLAQVLRDRRLLGILYPAVDGDFAALISSDAALAEDFQAQLRLACEPAQSNGGSLPRAENKSLIRVYPFHRRPKFPFSSTVSDVNSLDSACLRSLKFAQ